MRNAERQYRNSQDPARLRALGQFFTDPAIAGFMTRFACPGARTLLDPALGSGRFPRLARSVAPACAVTAYEIDPEVLRAFPPEGLTLRQQDYLSDPRQEQYDAIVCNPPYLRFQQIPGREALRRTVAQQTGLSLPAYANLFALFLAKSLHQLGPRGRLAYVIPTEFLSADYCRPLRQAIGRERLLRAVIRVEEDRDLFPGAVTTCCILLLDRQHREPAVFLSLPQAEALERLDPEALEGRRVPREDLGGDGWTLYLEEVPASAPGNLVPTETFFRAGRGIATGANDYFCLRRSQLAEFHIPHSCVTPCLCRSRDAAGPLFTAGDLEALAAEDKPLYLLDPPDPEAAAVYLARGQALGIPRKFLPAHREPWYRPEPQNPAPIWIAGACRDRIKVVRNLAGIRTLTTFHVVRPREGVDPDLLFAYLRCAQAQALLLRESRTMGQGLLKLQPGDLNRGHMLDLRCLSPRDRAAARALGREPGEGALRALDGLFRPWFQF